MAIDLQAVVRSAPLKVWAARATGLLLPQGLLVILVYSIAGFDFPRQSLPFGMRIDPLHAAMHIAWGAAGALAGFVRPAWSIPWLIVFGIYYVTLASLGTFTNVHFGLQLDAGGNAFHWFVGAASLIAGLSFLIRRGALR